MDALAANAELALLLEVTGTPKPGNVDRRRDHDSLRFEHFVAGAVQARPGLELAANGASVGVAFERAVAGMANQRGGNTQFGALLLLCPLVRAARRDLAQPVCETVVEETTVADAAAFYRAFEHVDVHVGDPPPGWDRFDVRRGAEAISAIEAEGVTLADVMAAGAPTDDVAREWTVGFERSFWVAEQIAAASGPIERRAARGYLAALADRADSFVATTHDESVAKRTTERAAELQDVNALKTDPEAVETFAEDLVRDGINPGTTADLTAAGLFIALEREAISV